MISSSSSATSTDEKEKRTQKEFLISNSFFIYEGNW
jgi:hypothetical protein